MIDPTHELSITPQAQILNISDGSVYYLARPIDLLDLAQMRQIDRLHIKHPFIEVRMLRDQLWEVGLHVGKRHLGTLMQRIWVGTTSHRKRAPRHKIYPYLLRHVLIERANQV